MVDVNTPAAGGRVYYGLAAAAAAAIMVVQTIIARDENEDLLCLFGLRMPFAIYVTVHTTVSRIYTQ